MIDLRQGDCLEIMKDIPDKSIDRIICGWCDHYVYKNDKARFKYKLKEEINKNKGDE